LFNIFAFARPNEKILCCSENNKVSDYILNVKQQNQRNSFREWIVKL
jgi:hypothetical protein